MKKTLLIATLLISVASWSYSADFVPTVLTLHAPATIEYQFDGTGLNIPLTVAGTNAAVWLVINTNGQAENIKQVRNGFLGWHYVNNVDTTVYVSSRYSREPGESSIVWNGTDQDGNLVGAGTYDYYLWAYDDKTARQMVCDFFPIATEWTPQFVHVYENGEDGLPMTQPMIMGAQVWYKSNPEITYKRHGTHFKWVIGSDPYDSNLLQTTMCGFYQQKDTGWSLPEGSFKYGGPVFNPNDFDIFYHGQVNTTAGNNYTPIKWQFVTDGEAIQDEDWGGWDNFEFEEPGSATVGWNWYEEPTFFTDGNYIYENSTGPFVEDRVWNQLICLSFDGELLFEKTLEDQYKPEDNNPYGYSNGHILNIYGRENNRWGAIGISNCMMKLYDTTQLFEDPEFDDYVVYENNNGDYFLDSAFEPDQEPNWMCFGDSKEVSCRRDTICIDSNGFSLIGVTYHGLTSFGVMTQDGTGMDIMSFADDQIADDAYRKGGGLLCDSGSSYDGLYWCEPITSDSTGDASEKTAFCAFDSIHGIITNLPTVAVEEDAQAAFAVDQNSPNPFNPVTSISFTLPAADHVTVDIYNVAGQKVDTLVNDFMETGKHSVVWDASGFSNGVYFYTLKSGDFSRTMKMTLLK